MKRVEGQSVRTHIVRPLLESLRHFCRKIRQLLSSLFCGNARFRKSNMQLISLASEISSGFAGSAGSCGWSMNLTYKKNRFLCITFQIPVKNRLETFLQLNNYPQLPALPAKF
jgi:hypothetical protein